MTSQFSHISALSGIKKSKDVSVEIQKCPFLFSEIRNISLSEIDEVAKIITQEISPEAKVIFGAI